MGILMAVTTGVTATGSAGSAAGNSDSAVFRGEITGVYLNYHASTPNTADVTITDKRTGVTIYAKTNSTTDHYAVPGIYAVDAAAAALTNNVTPEHYCVDQGVNVAIAQGNSLTNAVVATVFYRK